MEYIIFLQKLYKTFLNIIKKESFKNFIFLLFINLFFVFLFFPNILDKGFMFFSDNPSIISWNYFWDINKLSLWRDQSAIGVNDFALVLFRPLILLFGFLNLFLNNELTNKFQVILPIIILNIGTFILFKELFKHFRVKYFYIFIFSSLFQLSSIWLNNIYSGFIFPSLCLAFLPLCVYSIYTRKIKLFLLLSLTAPFSTLPGAFIFLAFYFILILFFHEKNRIKNIFLVLLFNIWWLLPIGISFLYRTIISGTYLSEYSKNILDYFNSSKFTEAFLGNTSWNTFLSFGATGDLVFFSNYKFTFLNLLFLILIILFFIFKRKYCTDFIRKMFFVLFIFLSASIFIRYIPVLNIIFKSTNRFLWVSDFLIIILVSFFTSKYILGKESKYKKYVVNIFLVGILAFSLLNLIELRNYNLKPISLPREYFAFSEKYSKNNYRAIFLPTERNWYLETEYNNIYNGHYLGIIDPLQYSVPESLTFFSIMEPYTDLYIKDKVLDRKFESTAFLDELRINLVVFHNYAVKGEQDNSYKIINKLKEDKNWSCVKNDALTICERISKLSNITSSYSDIYFEKVYSGKFHIDLKNITEKSNINFFESFHNGWKLYLTKYSEDKLCGESVGVRNGMEDESRINIECQSIQKFFEGEELSYLYKKPIFDDTHKIVYGYANQWTIDSEYIKKNFDKSYYKENPDGSIDIELTLYFKPQSYFYLSLIISGTTLIAYLGYLGYGFIKRRQRK